MASHLENLLSYGTSFYESIVGTFCWFHAVIPQLIDFGQKCILDTQNATELIHIWVIEVASLKKHFEFSNAIKLMSLL